MSLKNVIKTAIYFLCISVILNACSQKSNEAETIAKDSTKPKIDMHTAVMTNNIEVIKSHIIAKSDLNQKDPYGGSSPLISASLFGKTEIAKLLIEAGADINSVNNDGSTALITAAFFCRTDIVKMLLANNADKSIVNNFSNTAFESVSGPFENVRPMYDGMAKMLAPMGLVLDMDHLEKTRPIIAGLLK